MSEIFTLFVVFIAIFLFGMTTMRIGLYNLSENHLKEWLIKFTSTPVKGFIVGIVITALIQSSSAVTVLTVGLVAASYINFQQSIGIILGANIGTTFTTELITLHVSDWVIPLLLIGTILLLQKKNTLFCSGAILFGLGSIFTAMNGFEAIAKPLSSSAYLEAAMHSLNESTLLGIVTGTILTSIIQSSTATTGITMSFLHEHIFSLTAGIAVILGANIGTCITAFLASIGSKKEAKLTAYAHIWLNVLGVLAIYPFIHILTMVVETLSSLPHVQLAHASLLFNVITSVIALLLVRPFTFLVLKIHGNVSSH